MLRAFQKVPLRKSSWDGGEGGYFGCIEAWHRIDHNGSKASKITHRKLEMFQLEDWAQRRGQFAQDSSDADNNTVKALKAEDSGFRILFAQHKSSFRESVLSDLISDKILEALRLPGCSFASYQQPSGVFSYHTYPEGSSIDTCSRLSLVFRTPQKWETSLGGFFITHDFETGQTTALNIGYAFELDKLASTDESLQLSPALEAFLDKIQDCDHLWSHPLLLPNLFLVTHVQRVRSYTMDNLSRRVVIIEHSIGVTVAGQSQKRYFIPQTHAARQEDQRLFVDGHLQRGRAKVLTQAINDLSTWIIFAKRSPYWDIEAVKLLRKILDSSKRLQDYRGIPARIFYETFDFLQNFSEASLEVTQTSEERMKLQLNIIYTSIAQDDGQTSARLAASAGRDSTSMKIIALITAAYLPGTFIATLFSMGMFEWQDESGGVDDGASKSIVSPDFWIYWAVTIPLTIATLAGWASWWKFEERRFVRDIQQAVKDESLPRNRQDSHRAENIEMDPWHGFHDDYSR